MEQKKQRVRDWNKTKQKTTTSHKSVKCKSKLSSEYIHFSSQSQFIIIFRQSSHTQSNIVPELCHGIGLQTAHQIS